MGQYLLDQCLILMGESALFCHFIAAFSEPVFTRIYLAVFDSVNQAHKNTLPFLNVQIRDAESH